MPQSAPAAVTAHAPPGPHTPVVPQEPGPSSAQSGSAAFSARASQTPSKPPPLAAALQPMHAPSHGVSQQTPSTQRPVEQSPAVTQAPPAAPVTTSSAEAMTGVR